MLHRKKGLWHVHVPHGFRRCTTLADKLCTCVCVSEGGWEGILAGINFQLLVDSLTHSCCCRRRCHCLGRVCSSLLCCLFICILLVALMCLVVFVCMFVCVPVSVVVLFSLLIRCLLLSATLLHFLFVIFAKFSFRFRVADTNYSC